MRALLTAGQCHGSSQAQAHLAFILFDMVLRPLFGPIPLRRLAAGQQNPSETAGAGGDLHHPLTQAVDLLNALGGLAEIEERHGDMIIRGYSCPLVDAPPGHFEACKLAEALVTEGAGLPIHECCERGEITRCCFATSHA